MAIFPKLKIKAPKMAHHNLDHYFRTSMASGPLYPIDFFPVNAGDEHLLDFENLVNTQALLSPLYGSFKLNIEVYFAGTSLYVPKLWRNGSMQQADGTLDANYPLTYLPSQENGFPVKSVHPSSLAAYLGHGVGDALVLDYTPESIPEYQDNAIPNLMYYDIFRHYYLNRQLDKFYVIVNNAGTTPNDVYLREFNVSDLDDAFLDLPVNGGHDAGKWQIFADLPSESCHVPLGGMVLRSFMPDRMNVILNKNFYEKNVSTVQVSTAGDSFQVDQLVTAKKLWNSRNKDAMTSGTFKDWIRSHYGVTPKIMDDMPTFLGSTSSSIIFEDIRATTRASVDGDEQYLGDRGSAGLGYGQSRRFRVVADRPGYVMVIASIVPRVDYYQFSERYVKSKKLSDEFRPEFNGIGLQDVLVSDLSVDFSKFSPGEGNAPWPAEYDAQYDPWANSVGKQPAWIEYMTAVNKIRGTFCTTEKSWVLARDMNTSGTTGNPVQDVSIQSFVNPKDWNQPFALQDLTDQNFLVQFKIGHTVRSQVLKRLLPKF